MQSTMIPGAFSRQNSAKEKPTEGKDCVLRHFDKWAELLLAQSSDWAFLMKTGTAREYAAKRTKDHVLRFTPL
jgi:predicted glycosyl hydrolase (DUF1957 family)